MEYKQWMTAVKDRIAEYKEGAGEAINSPEIKDLRRLYRKIQRFKGKSKGGKGFLGTAAVVDSYMLVIDKVAPSPLLPIPLIVVSSVVGIPGIYGIVSGRKGKKEVEREIGRENFKEKVSEIEEQYHELCGAIDPTFGFLLNPTTTNGK